jgi:hypothetical protein
MDIGTSRGEVPSVVNILAYVGPPAPDLAAVPAAWRIDPLVLVVGLIAAVGYLAGVRRVQRAGGHWPAARTLAFFGLGLVGLAATAMGWPGVYAPVLFSVYALQVVALLMVVPLLLAWAGRSAWPRPPSDRSGRPGWTRSCTAAPPAWSPYRWSARCCSPLSRS